MNATDVALCKLINTELRNTPACEPPESASLWDDVCQTGTHLWLDTGDAEAAQKEWSPAFEALTTNNSLLNQEIQKGAYDPFITAAAEAIRSTSPGIKNGALKLEIHLALNACHGLRLARAFNATVSVELHTDLANDAEQSVEYGRRLHAFSPDHFLVKVPFTPAGLVAARRLGQENIPVNLTLGFSARQAYLAARFANPAYVNIFMGRLNSYVEQSGLGTGIGVGEKVTLVTQRVVSAMRNVGQADSHLIGASLHRAGQIPVLAGIDTMTLPHHVAETFRTYPPSNLKSQVGKDKEIQVEIHPRFSANDFNGSSLWDLEEPEHHAISSLMEMEVDDLSPEDLLNHFDNKLVGDFMPKWTLDEIDTILDDGKIPVHEKWEERLSTNRLGLDALMTASALGAFVNDQQALDDHVTLLLA
ncbi:transaldolase family protein [Pontiellaceae bacterium B1224]|nr:transaldolase family protein [Pontiellaceae bacterium B1224]